MINMSKKQKKRLRKIKRLALIFLTLTLSVLAYLTYIRKTHITSPATVIKTEDVLLGFRPTKYRGNVEVMGTEIIVLIEHDNHRIHSTATLQGNSSISAKDQVSVLFNPRKPSKCTIVETIKTTN
jgi:uncharacterized protein YpmB